MDMTWLCDDDGSILNQGLRAEGAHWKTQSRERLAMQLAVRQAAGNAATVRVAG
jgi:hypothetical protein